MQISRKLLFIASAAILTACGNAIKQTDTSLTTLIRPSAVPLVTVDPYFSVWSSSDRLNESPTRHWTGKEQPLTGAIRVDGTTYRIIGLENQKLETILPTIALEPWSARYVTDRKPAGEWTSPAYDDSAWQTGPGAFGSPEMPKIGTEWKGEDRDIWVRRTFELDRDLSAEELILEYSHDDVFELYVNGIEVANTGDIWESYIRKPLPAEAAATLKPGKVTIAAHCHNTVGGAYVDFGLFRKVPYEGFGLVAEQKSVSVLPTRTVYTFLCGGVEVEVIFTAPLLMDDLELLARPVNYLTWQIRAVDEARHDIQLYLEATPQLAVDDPSQSVISEAGSEEGVEYLRTGTVEQKILGKKGDNVRIDWGYFYLATPTGKGKLALADYYASKEAFTASGTLPEGAPSIRTENMLKEPVALAYVNDLGEVGSDPVCDYVLLGYDDIYSIQYFGENLRPYWNRKGDNSICRELKAAADEYNTLLKRCEEFDREMMQETEEAGGRSYAELCALAYRQAIAAHKLVESPQSELLWFSKENFSNGSIGTVDISYPSAPLFLLYNPELVKGMLNHIFYYSESGKWTKPFAAHDIGTYPLANGQTYGGDMPVEECGNMLILTAALASVEGNAAYAQKHWEVLTTWKDYLLKHGLDPENQLCTDDFAGHFAHNANLSIKAIMGIASYGMLAEMLSMPDLAGESYAKAREMAAKWKEMAADGDHYRLTFDKPGTWSQKYNLVWDKLLGLEIFDPEIARTELAYYHTQQNPYGLPLDNRRTYTKTDWIMWTATLSDKPGEFEQFVEPVYRFMNETTDRVPMSDWVYTDTPRQVGFQARSVVGGYCIKMLEGKLNR